MNYTMAGMILFTHNYQDCVDFYGSTLELEVLHRIDRPGETLTTFLLGDAYLMVESGGVASDKPKTLEQSPVKLRFNVRDVRAAADQLLEKGVPVKVTEHIWGTTAEFVDPDGNRCALRSDKGFGE
ncbi:VOC family protein [Ruegeria pomeroyi]|jgi:lactoylglutathione lyase|uniref:Glyoxalase family protein n=2 Tax=Ruegeria pomeroyi TaxID=89184 RepID=Q5LUY5_RUEPO|nr:VOC family protein [Ruegeria pomeroyi]AAV94222.1 glyoxalase family protein [Ruegeria pomeroyi DSS-3]NVK97748.1 VOC family protein [Ruegeria pomeroyi]NVL03253.1 VOC family protein [Ruegeria pomeroyi]QWV07797.1 VOC family protein [Ruegeria pomeroyi]